MPGLGPGLGPGPGGRCACGTAPFTTVHSDAILTYILTPSFLPPYLRLPRPQPVYLHGSLGREAATGRGTTFAIRELLKVCVRACVCLCVLRKETKARPTTAPELLTNTYRVCICVCLCACMCVFVC